jgi:Nucleotidyl transferase AbiEii toxin, Type IV TA system
MDVSKHVAKYEDQGFTRERAEVNALMENAALVIFREFPDAFVLFGGATLVLYHGSARHSADLDLLPRSAAAPSPGEIVGCLQRDLTPIAELLRFGELDFEILSSKGQEGKISVTARSRQRLFRIDLTRFGSAIASEVEDHPIDGETAVIRSASKELLLLQKAEAFLLRRAVKARDAYDIRLLQGIGSALNPILTAHLQDTVLGNEIDSATITDRIAEINVNLCRMELKPILPPTTYGALEEEDFEPLRDALRELYKEWL